MRYLLEQQWIQKVAVDGTILSGTLYSSSRIKPTAQGLYHVEQRRDHKQALLKALPHAAEIAGRLLKGYTGA